jgi:hypothetical protein
MCSAARTVVARNVSLHHISHKLHHVCQEEDLPEEGREYNSGNATAEECAVAGVSPVGVIPAHSHGNEGCKPEDHGDELDSGNRELVRCCWEARWCQKEVCDSEERPDGAEQHEVDAVGRPAVVGWTIVGVDNCDNVSTTVQHERINVATYDTQSNPTQ